MQMHDMNSCVVQEISGLSYGNDPAKQMRAFCDKNLKPASVKYKTGTMAAPGALYPFYVFTEGTAYSSVRYGSLFAQFILDHKLGEVIASPSRENLAFHRGAFGQVWIWAPDTNAIQAWYKAALAAGSSLNTPPTGGLNG